MRPAPLRRTLTLGGRLAARSPRHCLRKPCTPADASPLPQHLNPLLRAPMAPQPRSQQAKGTTPFPTTSYPITPSQTSNHSLAQGPRIRTTSTAPFVWRQCRTNNHTPPLPAEPYPTRRFWQLDRATASPFFKEPCAQGAPLCLASRPPLRRVSALARHTHTPFALPHSCLEHPHARPRNSAQPHPPRHVGMHPSWT
jgi:hypothetical protein